MRITAADNPLLRRLRRLAESPRACRDAGRTLIEGEHLIEAALAAGLPIHTLVTRGARVSALAAQIADAVQASASDGGGFRQIELPATLYDALSPVEHGILLLATYELKHRTEIPYRVVINEAVELAKSFGGTEGFRYVNGVLDKVAAQLRPAEVNARG